MGVRFQFNYIYCWASSSASTHLSFLSISIFKRSEPEPYYHLSYDLESSSNMMNASSQEMERGMAWLKRNSEEKQSRIRELQAMNSLETQLRSDQ